MTPDHQPLPGEEQQAGAAATQPLFPALPVRLGDYELTQHLGRHGSHERYIAHQTHVERRVVLEILRPTARQEDQAAAMDHFLALARTRSAARLPRVVPVLESSLSPEGYAYICQPLPEGSALSAMGAEGKQLTVQQACDLIHAAAELYAACTEGGFCAGELRADMVFMNRAGHFHFLSPVLAAPHAADEAAQLRALAAAIRPVQPRNVPGQGRLATLLQWMQEGYEGEPLDWPATATTAQLIAEQITPEPILHLNQPQHYDRGRERREGKRRQRQRRQKALLLLAAACTVILMGIGGVFLAPESVAPLPAHRGGHVHLRDGEKTALVDARPVSIAEYRDFLIAWPELDAPRRGSLARDVPPAESDPTPADWEAQFRAGDLQAPVTNVSYWQALMYARYHRAALPTAAQLHTARREAGHPGMEEWTQDTIAPEPPYTRAHLVLPATASASPLPESNPAARTPQRSFRLCH